jgi:hypothetical protein
MRCLVWQWQMIVAAFAKHWRTEVASENNPRQLAPIRCTVDPRGIYLA